MYHNIFIMYAYHIDRMKRIKNDTTHFFINT